MYRATTPTHTFTLPIDTNTCKIIKVIYRQGTKKVIKTYRDNTLPDGMTLDGDKVVIKLTQEETLSFKASDAVLAQVRVLTVNNDALTSRRFFIRVDETQDEEILK